MYLRNNVQLLNEDTIIQGHYYTRGLTNFFLSHLFCMDFKELPNSINSIIIALVSYYSSRKLIVGYFCVKRVYG